MSKESKRYKIASGSYSNQFPRKMQYLFVFGHSSLLSLSLMCICTCKPDLLVAEQAKDTVVELHVSAVALVHLSQYSHQLCTSLSGMGALALVCWQLMERTLPRAANPLVLTLRHPGNIMASVS